MKEIKIADIGQPRMSDPNPLDGGTKEYAYEYLLVMNNPTSLNRLITTLIYSTFQLDFIEIFKTIK